MSIAVQETHYRNPPPGTREREPSKTVSQDFKEAIASHFMSKAGKNGILNQNDEDVEQIQIDERTDLGFLNNKILHDETKRRAPVYHEDIPIHNSEGEIVLIDNTDQESPIYF